ncbi:hypothetical protein DBV15_03818 [Temnothorax longispinosus]|uniref:Uncharacterized protein n=1 Tax=Temnothorax longispinosus TaxID=300112 RepID=A0A4S2J9Q8_9HYME|nr:hypothetical protein DBV15_03818 [Temnothorax longispinosus]
MCRIIAAGSSSHFFCGTIAPSLGVATRDAYQRGWSPKSTLRQGRTNEFWQRVSGRKSLGLQRVRRDVEESTMKKQEKERMTRQGRESRSIAGFLVYDASGG